MSAEMERPILGPVSGDGVARVRALLKSKQGKSEADDRAINGSLWERVSK